MIVKLNCTAKEDRTLQSAKDECDINKILSKYERNGSLPSFIKENPQYGDFSSLPDYQAALDIVDRAETQFSQLSAEVKARFLNDPSKFLDFMSNANNIPEMEKLGLTNPKLKPAVPEIPPVIPAEKK